VIPVTVSVSDMKVGVGIVAPDSGIIEIGGVSYNYASGCEVYIISDDLKTVTPVDVESFSDDSTATVSAVTEAYGESAPTAAQQNNLVAIFIHVA
jgi:hypothetical protein